MVVLAVVLIAGSRLIVLSVREHSVRAHEAAQLVVEGHVQLVRAQLQRLADQARRAPAGSAAPQASNVVWLNADGQLLTSPNADRALAQTIVEEWRSTETRAQPFATELLGPMRYGSAWAVAIVAPVASSAALSGETAAAEPERWSIAYRNLDDLLTAARIGAISGKGYDFELSQGESAPARRRTFLSSRTEPLTKAVERKILPPAGVEPSAAGVWTLAIRPQQGWYPLNKIAADIGLLVLVAWLLALFVFDARRDSVRFQGALKHSRRRLEEASKRLVTEIEERAGLQESLEHARYHDAFTGLPNRRYFMDRLDRLLRDVRVRRGPQFAVALIEIDRFQLITDTLGHTSGDEVMVQASRRFDRAAAALECVFTRWDAHRFAVLLLNAHSKETARAFAALLQESLNAPFELRGHRLGVAASVGLTHVDSGLKRAEEVVREADVALSVAKSDQFGKLVVYDTAMGGNVVSMVTLEADLHVALAREEFRLLYQPIVDLNDNRIVGAEALLRWQHPTEDLLGPDQFMLIAEDTGIIVPITRWVIRRACNVAAEWLRRVGPAPDFYLSINLSAVAMRHPGLSEFIGEVLRATSLSPANLKFELTEGALINNPGAAREALARLRELGVQLMLDDFGTGYSSLSHLQLFPFDYVKIDRPFVDQAGAESVQSGITSAMVQMASSLGMHAIAERIETETAVGALKAMGCRFAQGHFFAGPMGADEVLRLLRTQFGARSPAQQVTPPVPQEEVSTPDDDDSPTMVLPIVEDAQAEEDWTQAVQILEIGTADQSKESGEPSDAPDEVEPRKDVGASSTDEGERTPESGEERSSLGARLRRRFSPG